MASNTNVVPRGGRATLTLTAGQSIAVQASAPYTISLLNNYPNYPAQLAWQATVAGGPQTVYGPYATGAVIQIDMSFGDDCYYEIGTSPIVQTTQRQVGNVGAATVQAVNASATMTTANLLGDIITSSTAAAVSAQLPLGTALDAASAFSVGDYLDFIVVNTGPNTFTVTTNTGWTLVGSMAVATATSARFRIMKTAAGTFTLYRVA